jgi:DNA-binding NarL/FixJ family response regulator
VLGRGIEPPFTSTNSDTPTARETEVLRLLARGYSNAQIAEHLQISERTVKFHITSLFARLGAKRRTEAVAIARERGYLSP